MSSNNIMGRPLLCIFTCIMIYASRVEGAEISCSVENPCPLTGGSALPRCPELISKDGFLEVALTVEIGNFQFDWLRVDRRSYGGSTCPPTWRVKPGDRLNVTVVNNLENGTHVPGTDPVLNVTNLHVHGLHISPLPPQDYVFLEIKPGESYQYSYEIRKDHAAGAYWYHAHHHSSTSVQTIGGMAGMLIIEDDPETMEPELRAVSCPENCEHDVFLMIVPMLKMPFVFFAQNSFKDSLRFDPSLEQWLAQNVDEFTVNGILHPVLSITKNQLTRFRMLHVGLVSPIEVSVVDNEENVAPCEIREIARDGVYFDEPTIPRTGQSVLFPGNRLEWLIKCTDTGTYQIRSITKEQHKLSFAGVPRTSNLLVTLQVNNGDTSSLKKMELNFPKRLPPRPRYLDDLRNVVPDQYIAVEIGGNAALNREHWSGPENYRFKVEVDSVVEVQMTSADYDFSHPMHFHVNHMQVIGFEPYNGPVALYKLTNPIWEFRDMVDGEPCYYQHSNYIEGATAKEFNITDPLKFQGHYSRWKEGHADSLAYPETGQWMDTVHSPALSNITLRIKMDSYTGPLHIHCHNPLDADWGMAIVIDIVEKGADIGDANTLSAGAPPGSCKKCDWNRFVEMPPECMRAVGSSKISPDVIMNLLFTLLMALQNANEPANEELLN